MKKLIQLSILFALILFSFKAKAQITITNANMPASGDTIRYSSCKPSSVNYTVTGANVFWNYDTLVPTGQGLYNYTPASATPYAFYFLGGDYGLKIADSIGVATYKFYNVYDFYKNTTAAFETKGIGFTYSGFPLAATYNPVDKIYVFPLNYLNHDSTPYKVTVALTSTVSYTQFGYRITDVDGWGVIKTPYDSVACLRLISTTYGKDSINYNGFGFANPNVQRSYKWMSVTEKIPVLELDGTYTGGNFVPTQARYRDKIRSFAGIKQITETNIKISLYPNPTSGDLYIYSSSTDVLTINIYDVSGVLVETYKTNGMITKASMQNLSKGCYFYNTSTKDGALISTGKIIIITN
jgi:hypothetical protein